jgi:uncharacterized membrane-anchored protein YhcB (DUF1043 family)
MIKPETDMEQYKSEMNRKYAETQELLKNILENQNKPNP